MSETDSGVFVHRLERTDVKYRLAKGDPCFDITVFMEDGQIVKLVICSGIGERIELRGHNINNAIDVMRTLVSRSFDLTEGAEEPKDE